mgnify:CR=1 FL=1
MFTINAVSVTDAVLTDSNVTEADATEYSSAHHPYNIGATVMVTTTANGASVATHKIYTSTASSNSADPTLRTTYVSGDEDVFWWTEVGSTNRFKMFDGVVQSQTVFAGGIEVELTPTTYTPALALINVNAASVDVVVDSTADGEVYNESYSLVSDSGIDDWYEYFFTPIERISELVLTDLPSYLDATITVSINDATSAACGELIVGTMFTIGQSLHGANLGIIDYSVKTTNEITGNVTVQSGPYARRAQVDVMCDTARTPAISNYLASIRQQPVVWVPDVGNAATITYGFFKEFNVILSDNYTSLCNLQIEGLT